MYTFFHWMQYLWNSLAIWQDQNTSTYTVWVPPSTYTHTQTYKLSVQLSKYICTTIQNIFFSLCFFLFQIKCYMLQTHTNLKNSVDGQLSTLEEDPGGRRHGDLYKAGNWITSIYGITDSRQDQGRYSGGDTLRLTPGYDTVVWLLS